MLTTVSRACVAAVVAVLAAPSQLFAQDLRPAVAPPPPVESRTVIVAKFLAGAATGLAIHEGGHAAAGWHYESRRHGIALTSAGFWAQYAGSEVVLSRHPRLREERAPFRKGLVAFHLGTCALYSILAVTKTGPAGRDTVELAENLRVNERWLAPLVLTPAVFDGIRYLRPGAAWAKWLARTVKLASVAVVLG